MYYGRTNSTVGGGSTPQMQTQSKEVKATSFPTQVIPDEGYYLTSVKVNAPDNLAAGNIKQGVSIAGVTGTYEGSASTLGTADIKPTTFPTTKNASDDGVDGYSTVTVQAPDNLVAGNIKKDVTIAGVTGTYEGSGSGSNPEAEFFKALVTTNSPIRPANAPTGLITTVTTLNNWPTHVYVGPDGLDLSAVDSYTLELDYLNQYYTAGTNETTMGGAIKVGNVNLVMKYSALSGFPEGTWKLYVESFSNVRFFSDALVLTEAHVPDGIIMTGAFNGVTKTKLTNVNVNESLTLTLPANITAIKGYSAVAGNGSAKLNLIMQATTPPTVESEFTVQSLKSITVPAGSLEAYQTATNWSKFADIMVEATEAGA